MFDTISFQLLPEKSLSIFLKSNLPFETIKLFESSDTEMKVSNMICKLLNSVVCEMVAESKCTSRKLVFVYRMERL